MACLGLAERTPSSGAEDGWTVREYLPMPCLRWTSFKGLALQPGLERGRANGGTPPSDSLLWTIAVCALSLAILAGCSTLRSAESREPGCPALTLLALGSTLFAAPARAAGCSALLAGAPVWPWRLARSLLPSVMTASFNSVFKVANGRRCLCSYCRTFHEEQRGDTSSCRGLGVFVSTETAARSC